MTKILLADDSVTIQKVVELTFSDEGSQVVSVSDGSSALEKAQIDRPDIILSDVVMPGMSGYDFCQKVKSDPGLRSIPFLFLKGTFESFDEEKARQCGSDGFIVKPFDSQDLIDKVAELVEQAKAGPGTAPPAVETPATAGLAAPASAAQAPVETPSPAPAPVQDAPPPAVAVPPPPPPPPPVMPVESVPVPETAADALDLGEEMEISAPAGEPGQDDDLWSEVSLRETSAPLVEDKVLEEESFWGTDENEPAPADIIDDSVPSGEDLLEEIEEPEILDLTDDDGLAPGMTPADEDETTFDLLGDEETAVPTDVAPAAPSEPPAETAPAAADVAPDVGPAPAEEVLSEPVAPPAAVPAPTGSEMEQVISGKIEEAVRSFLGPAIGDTARKIIEEVA